MKTTINIGGDLCITPEYESGNLFADNLKDVFRHSDLNIVNLECPIVEKGNGEKIIKTGPHLHSTAKIFNQLKKLNVHTVTLANNHILDFGETGVESTLQSCMKANISFAGAGRNLSEAALPLIKEVNGLRIAVVNFCENEWSVATASSWGANPMNVIDNLQQIKNARQQADFVLVIIHGGHEIYHLPSPRMVKEYRFFAENGADAVIGHHPHCISGYEVHHGVPIIYSLGNFLFTMNTPYDCWYTGLMVSMEVKQNKVEKFSLIPVIQDKKSFQLSIPDDGQKNKILDEVEHYSAIIRNKEQLDRNWEQFIQKKHKNIQLLSPLNGLPGRILKKGLSRIGMNRILMRRTYLSEILNHIRCEAHRDIMISLLQKKMIK
jgi:poly-gamma-glutamate capsule biosynthesis protein CapA/YwtB (metallophosphatase superfamily)